MREKIPFLWFVGNISVLKFWGCPAETGAKISFILFRWLNHLFNNFRQNETRDDNREKEENNWTFNVIQMLLNTTGKLKLRWKMFFPNYERYIIPEGAIKSQVKSLSLEDVLTQVNRDLGVSSIYKIIYVVHNLWIHDFANSANIC